MATWADETRSRLDGILAEVRMRIDDPDVLKFRIGRTTDLEERKRWYRSTGKANRFHVVREFDQPAPVHILEAYLLRELADHPKLDNDALDSRGGTDDDSPIHIVYLAIKRRVVAPA